MSDSFAVLDLSSQGIAVQQRLAKLPEAEKVAWLGRHGSITAIPKHRIDARQCYRFESVVGLECVFFIDGDDLVFIGDHTTYTARPFSPGWPMQFRLRTLLIVLAVLPPVLAGIWFAWGHLTATSRETQLQQLNAEIAQLRAKQNAEIAELTASQDARRLKIRRLKQEIIEKESGIAAKEFQLHELSRTNLMEAEPGIYFLGPELLPLAESY
jgi:outer membrane murein-binding lipoprotein Lpp